MHAWWHVLGEYVCIRAGMCVRVKTRQKQPVQPFAQKPGYPCTANNSPLSAYTLCIMCYYVLCASPCATMHYVPPPSYRQRVGTCCTLNTDIAA